MAYRTPKNNNLVAQYHRLAARRGRKRAIVAVAHSLLIIVYYALERREPYRDLGANYFDERDRTAVEQRLIRRLEKLGNQVTLQPQAADFPRGNPLVGRSIEEKRAMIDQLETDYTVRRFGDPLECPPSTYSYQSQAVSDEDLITAIEDLLMRWPVYGYRRVLKHLQCQDWLDTLQVE
jgi:hypothetical protein